MSVGCGPGGCWMTRLKTFALVTAVASVALAGCGKGSQGAAGGDGLTGKVTIDGSTTVYPVAQMMGDDFRDVNGDVKVDVGKAGTGSGFQKFLRGEVDIATASRPIKEEEDAALKAKGIEYVEVPIAYDGLSVIVNKDNTWVDHLTMDELKKAWAPGSTVKLWSDIRPSFPKEKITFYGPTDNHGTYEYFTEAVNGKKNEIREEYQPNQEYNAIVQSVRGDKGAIAYVGFNYFEENKADVKAVPIDAGSGAVAPSAESIGDGTYTPLSRPLFLYVSKKALARPEVKAFLEFALGDGLGAVTETKYVMLPKEAYEAIKKNLAAVKTGSMFKDFKPGMKMSEVLEKESGG
jgi:phosphate transport system substrate-binding protein